MKSQLIILGSGSSVGVPRIDGVWGNCSQKNKKNIRTRCSAIIIKGSNHILIDTSPDIRLQFLSNKIKKVSSVLFTHEHADQTNGLFELRPFFWKYKKKIDVYGNLNTINHLKKRHDYLFKKISNYPAIVKAKIVKQNFSIGKSKEKIIFKTLTAKHGSTRSVIYVFENTAYISDCNDLLIEHAKVLKNLNLLIIDCLKYKKHYTHFNLEEALYIHKKLNPKKTILTNLHHDIDYDLLLRKLPKNVFPAYDGLSLSLKK
jgi:phosphoribosyl 1,2-cyclic phosphate phosphodiesterase